MERASVDLVAIAPSANMRYLLGFSPFADERPCALLLSREAISMVVPLLNADQVEANTGLKSIRWEDSSGPIQAYEQALSDLGVKPGSRLSVDNTMRADALLLLSDLARPANIIAAGDLMAILRICKSPEEIEILAQAAAMADKALLAGVQACQPGVTEREVAEKIHAYFRKSGAELVDFVFVASGPNGAFPHYDVGDRRLEPGDIIILDIGATLDGYKSDITRVVSIGEPSAEARKVYEVVWEANESGRKAAVAGVKARKVDLAARGVIEKAGYGPYFKHRTGHGIGLEVHERPWITSETDVTLEPGMAFSVEPGIYLEGKFGIRIEDIVIVTEGECRCLTGVSHDLFIN
jgi:Xaa-Pro aminopeptidase